MKYYFNVEGSRNRWFIPAYSCSSLHYTAFANKWLGTDGKVSNDIRYERVFFNTKKEAELAIRKFKTKIYLGGE